MAMHLITGHSGTAHISAADDGALNAAIVGEGSYVFGFGDDFAATMTTANSVTIGTGALVHQGRKAWCSTSTQLTVVSGTQAQRRHDLVVARYTKTGDVEDMQLAVVKGTPVSYGDPSDPEHEDGSVIDGATVSDFPLWRIPIDGITPGTPVRLFDVTPSLAELRDSVSQRSIFTGGATSMTSDADGTFRVAYSSPTGAAPRAVIFQPGPFTGAYEGQGGPFNVLVWGTPDLGSARFRIWDASAGTWAGRVAVFGYWLAMW